jgi:hypothetical protein
MREWNGMALINMGGGYTIETLEGGYKILRCPDDTTGESGHGIAAYRDVSLFEFKRLCKEFISDREGGARK